ncbi:MAG TPA: amino acid adenylation domain-containing protein, partial [Blastocatellia bacterium]|nr:amino acid adenylation domain-containing protein [Blastocatellia bacterium]
ALLAKLLEERANKPQVYPLSFAQQRLWFFDQWEKASPVYNIPAAIRLRGRLDKAALERSLNEIVRRHETLRTRIGTSEGEPVQIVERGIKLKLEEEEIEWGSEQEREERARREAAEEASRGFDLREGPLIRGKLLRLGEEDHVLLLTMHHIISDGWSIGVLINEVSALYSAFSKGEPSPLEDLPIQYADYAVWQRDYMKGEKLEKQLSYWTEHLAGELPTLQLQTDFPRPPVQTYRGAKESLWLPKSLSSALKELSRREGATLFMTLLAAFKALLYRYTGQEDIIVGTPIANRNRSEIESLIGFFVNTLVLRTDLSGDPTFIELIRRVREVALGAYANQDVPFEKLTQALQVQRDLSRSPLFQILFMVQNSQIDSLQLPGLTLQPMDTGAKTAKFDLTVVLEDSDQGLLAAVEYNTDLFESHSIARLLSHFHSLLQAAASDPLSPISQLPLLSHPELHHILVSFNQSPPCSPRSPLLHHLFQLQVERTPENIAVRFRDQAITYSQLNQRANRLAHYLIERGVKIEDRVGLCCYRSIEMVVGLLAILKAGAAYVPLDPDHPAARLRDMIEQADITHILVGEGAEARLPEVEGIRIRLDDESLQLSGDREENPELEMGGKNLAYVIYTSGTTGRPKGAMNTHEAITNRIEWMQMQYGLREEDVVLQKTPYSFDVSVWEYFWPLMSGASIAMAEPGGHRDSRYLVEEIERRGVSVMHFVPSMLEVFLREEGVERLRGVRLVICSGEALSEELKRRYYERMGGELENLYGPTEAAVDVTYWRCERGETERRVAIGRPISNVRIYILDKEKRVVPEGVAGEIHIAGKGVGRGYIKQGGQTAERYLPDPYSEAGGERMYATGDKGRWVRGGVIEYLGREDGQVKIRGNRIEIGEVEGAMRRIGGVREAAVQVKEGEGGEKRLVGYVVVKEGEGKRVEEIRREMREMVPEYMVPAAIVELEEMPLNANGKLDRKALPDPDFSRDENASYVTAGNEIEGLLTSVWQEVLGRKPIGIHDDLFFLGGDSIRVIQIVQELSRYGLSVTARDVFRMPTIHKLAGLLASGNAGDGQSPIPFHLIELPADIMSALPDDVEDAYPASRLQEYMLDKYINDGARSGIYHIQQWFHVKDETLSLDALKKALTIVAQRHPAFRTGFIRREGNRRVQIVKKSVALSIAEEDITHLSDGEQQAYIDSAIDKDILDPFDSDNCDEPLFRFKLFLRTERSFEFVMSVHHAIYDGWGNIEFLKELFDLYIALKSEEDAPAEPVTNTYREFIALEQEILASDEAREFWRDHLRNEDHAALPKIDSADDGTSVPDLSLDLDGSLAVALQAVAQKNRVSLKTMYLAAYLELIGKLSRKSVATVGIISNGRSERLTDPLRSLGLFWNIVPFCSPVGSGDGFELLKNVQKSLIDVEGFSMYPLPQILEDRGKDELFFATFNFVNFHNAQGFARGVGIELISSGTRDRFGFPLNLRVSLSPFGGGVKLNVSYDSMYFTAESVQSLITDYVDLLRGLTTL